MSFLDTYKFLIIPFMSLFIAQLSKCMVETIKNKKFDIMRFLNGNGGMPSTHSAVTSSLCVALGYSYGFDSAIFAIAMVFTMIVFIDAMGVRLQSEKQAEVINILSSEIKEDNPNLSFKKLKEQIGHEPFEVLIGILVGVLVSVIMMNII